MNEIHLAYRYCYNISKIFNVHITKLFQGLKIKDFFLNFAIDKNDFDYGYT